MTQQVYTLLVEVGRKKGDGLPDGSTVAATIAALGTWAVAR